jgi:metal-sulfur cluster biosynthetic enzyme
VAIRPSSFSSVAASKSCGDKTMASGLDNDNPIVYEVADDSIFDDDLDNIDEDIRDVLTSLEVFEYIRHLNDPEHPLTLEQLNVVSPDNITVNEEKNAVAIYFTPTIPHCSMATLIGLCIRVKLIRSLPKRYKMTVKISPGSHQSEESVNKQLNDKERVAAALENTHLLSVVNKCIAYTDK